MKRKFCEKGKPVVDNSFSMKYIVCKRQKYDELCGVHKKYDDYEA